jgi:hypothetical protein
VRLHLESLKDKVRVRDVKNVPKNLSQGTDALNEAYISARLTKTGLTGAMAKFKEPLYNQARKEGLGHVQNAICHGHLGASFPLLGLLFFGK